MCKQKYSFFNIHVKAEDEEKYHFQFTPNKYLLFQFAYQEYRNITDYEYLTYFEEYCLGKKKKERRKMNSNIVFTEIITS